MSAASSSEVQVEALLDELQALQRVGVGKLRVDPGEPLLHGLGGALAASLRLVRLQRFEIAPNGSTLIAAFGERRLVLI